MDSFRFKQFEVAHDKCAMKVNTDGVLLGAWANVEGACSILDVGTGTGVIALMAAQRNPTALIDAIDISAQAVEQSKANFANSPWRQRLQIIHTSFQMYFAPQTYDVIISNPPYFINDFKSFRSEKNMARHGVALTYQELVAGIARLLSPDGRAAFVIPHANFSFVLPVISSQQLFVTKLTEVIAVQGKPPYLRLIEVSRQPVAVTESSLSIQTATGTFTEEYQLLTRDFYLKF